MNGDSYVSQDQCDARRRTCRDEIMASVKEKVENKGHTLMLLVLLLLVGGEKVLSLYGGL